MSLADVEFPLWLSIATHVVQLLAALPSVASRATVPRSSDEIGEAIGSAVGTFRDLVQTMTTTMTGLGPMLHATGRLTDVAEVCGVLVHMALCIVSRLPQHDDFERAVVATDLAKLVHNAVQFCRRDNSTARHPFHQRAAASMLPNVALSVSRRLRGTYIAFSVLQTGMARFATSVLLTNQEDVDPVLVSITRLLAEPVALRHQPSSAPNASSKEGGHEAASTSRKRSRDSGASRETLRVEQRCDGEVGNLALAACDAAGRSGSRGHGAASTILRRATVLFHESTLQDCQP